MTTYIALFRAVMPTGKNSLLMAPFRTELERAGFTDVRTYIQSGNVVLSSELEQTAVEQRIHNVIATAFGGDIAVLARTAAQFQAMLQQNPFADADPKQVHITLLATTPTPERVTAFLQPGYAPDDVQIIADTLYLRCNTLYSASKISNALIERKLAIVATTRVYRTIEKLIALADSR